MEAQQLLVVPRVPVHLVLDLTGFDRPTLLLVGSDDRLIPNPETFALARDLASVEMKAIADAGHVASIQAPERVAEAVTAFLNSKKKAA